MDNLWKIKYRRVHVDASNLVEKFVVYKDTNIYMWE